MRWTSLTLLLCLLWLSLPVAMAAPASGQATEQQVLNALDVSKIDADYVVLIDTSGSMESDGLYLNVRNALSPLVDALSPTDHLSLITFDTVPTLRYDGPMGTAGASVLNQLPPTADGLHTDIGAAINAGLSQLERTGASQIGTIILMTDGLDDPGPGSAYPTTSGPEWAALAARAKAVSGEHAINAFALALRQDTDAALLETVFSQASVVALPGDQVGPYFTSLKAQIGQLKASALLAADIPTITATWTPASGGRSDDQQDFTVTLRSNATHIPLTVTGLGVRDTARPVSATGLPNTLSLAPDQSKSFLVQLTDNRQGGFGFGTRQVVDSDTATLTGQVGSPWSQVMTQQFRLSPDFRLASQAQPVTFVTTTGWSVVTLTLAAAGLVVVALALRMFRRSRQPRLHGALVLTDSARHLGDFPLHGRRMAFGKGALRSIDRVRGTIRAVRRQDPVERRSEHGVVLKISQPHKATSTLWHGEGLDLGDDLRADYTE